jgi:hypothetical protein
MRFTGSEGPVLISRHMPVIEIPGDRITPSLSGYKDILCERLGATLAEGRVTKEEITLRLNDGRDAGVLT